MSLPNEYYPLHMAMQIAINLVEKQDDLFFEVQEKEDTEKEQRFETLREEHKHHSMKTISEEDRIRVWNLGQTLINSVPELAASLRNCAAIVQNPMEIMPSDEAYVLGTLLMIMTEDATLAYLSPVNVTRMENLFNTLSEVLGRKCRVHGITQDPYATLDNDTPGSIKALVCEIEKDLAGREINRLCL